MPEEQVSVVVGAAADWGHPVRLDDEFSTVCFEAWTMNRLTFADGRTFSSRGVMIGMDDVLDDGQVPKGFAAVEWQDADGDCLRGRIDFFVDQGSPTGADRATYAFSSGTGKWAGATGLITVNVDARPDDVNASWPVTAPMKWVGLLEGEGTLDAPALAGGSA